MITCPKCGAGNKPGSSVCRMCATPLDAFAPPAMARPDRNDSLSPTVVFSEHQSQQPATGAEGISCPNCRTMNEADWAFCQQCGTKLPKAAPPPPQVDYRPPQGLETVVAQPAIREQDIIQGQKTVADHPVVSDPRYGQAQQQEDEPDAAQGKPTVVAQPPAREPQPMRESQPAREPQPGREPQMPLGQPTVVSPPPVIPPPVMPPPQQMPSSYATQPPTPSPVQPAEKFSPPPQPSAASSGTEEVQSYASPKPGPTTPCPQCSYPNNTGSAFCSNCGASLTVAKTILMSSITAPPKARLHLVMEGGQQGEVYDVDQETVVGRTSGDITFPHDGFMSGRHARIERRGTSFVLVDEGSRNGTFIRIKGEVELKPGDMILIGKQLFRFEV